MDKKIFLKQICQIDQLILCNQEELKRLEEQSTGISGGNYSGDRVRGGGFNKEARFTEIVSDMLILREQIEKDTKKMVSLKKIVRSALEKMENVEERLLLQRKYFLGESWKMVAYHLKISDSAVFRLHQSALAHLELEI